MAITYTPITLDQLTSATTDGTGVFDVMMRATASHLEQEFKQGRIKGTEYATVYLGSLQAAMTAALQFTLQKEQMNLDAQIKAQEIELGMARVALAQSELAISEAKLVNIPKEGALLEAQVVKTLKDVSLADEQILLAKQEVAVKEQQVLVAQAEVGIAQAKLVNIPKEGLVLDAQALKIGHEAELVQQQTVNAQSEHAVILANECKLRAEFDLIRENVIKAAAETSLLNQKIVTERAQTVAIGVDDDSVMGRQKALYFAQANGFTRDAEQKAADLLIKSWATRRTTDEATSANSTNMLDDATVGRTVLKLLNGVGA